MAVGSTAEAMPREGLGPLEGLGGGILASLGAYYGVGRDWVSLCNLDLGLPLLAECISSQGSELEARGREREFGDSLPGSFLSLTPVYYPLQPWEGLFRKEAAWFWGWEFGGPF